MSRRLFVLMDKCTYLQTECCKGVFQLHRDDVDRLVLTTDSLSERSRRSVSASPIPGFIKGRSYKERRPLPTGRHLSDAQARGISRQRLALFKLSQSPVGIDLKVDQLGGIQRENHLSLVGGGRNDLSPWRARPVVDRLVWQYMAKSTRMHLEQTRVSQLLYSQRRNRRMEPSVVDFFDRLADGEYERSVDE